jgi:predicted DNA binding protein
VVSIIERLRLSASVFVSKDELTETERDALKAAGHAIEQDVVRDGWFVRVLSDFEKAQAETESAPPVPSP